MAILQMQRIFIYALKKDRKQMLELLQRRGVVEIGNMVKEDKVFHKSDVSDMKAGFEKNISAAKEAADILNNYIPEKKPLLAPLYGRKEIQPEVYDAFKDKYELTVKTAYRLKDLVKKIAENKAEILKLKTQIEVLTPWMGLDIPFDFQGTKFTKGFIGTLPNEWNLDAVYGKLAELMPLDVEIISSSKEQTCLFIICSKEKADAVYEALRGLDFSLPGFTSDKSPSEQLEHLNKEITRLEADNSEAVSEILTFGKYKEDILFLQDYDTMRLEKYEVIGHLVQSKNVFIVTGFIPQKDVKALTDELNGKFELYVEVSEPAKKDDVPVLLKNNGFSKPLEGVLAGYSLPSKGEVDPTMVMSLFYYMLFGLMLSDAGYGIIMAAGCAFGLIKFKKTLEPSMKNALKMYLYCGISTIFWGIMFGSYFGDIFDVTARTFFGRTSLAPVIPPLWFFPVNEPMRMLAFSMLIGIIHLLTGLVMKFYQQLKQKDIKGIFYDTLSWFMLVVSSSIILLSMDMIKNILKVNITIPPAVKTAMTVLAVISAVTIILTNGRESRNPFKRFLKGLYALYGITGYLSDVLSYSRLLALGLATGVIGNVINKMAAMTGKGLLGPLFFIIVVVFGHTVNIAINALGSYVHTNRLHYVEFFGKFYGGGGRKFEPFSIKTKYYKIKEKV